MGACISAFLGSVLMKKIVVSLISLILITSCANQNIKQKKPDEALIKFAFANCLLWYFESKSYESDDIRSISGGIVETNNISIDKFQEIALFVQNFEPASDTKNDIDPMLLRCFYLDNDDEFIKIISE